MAGRQNKVLVTGSSSGIGLEIAKTLLNDGFYVVLHGSGENRGTIEALQSKFPDCIDTWWFDLAEDPSQSFELLIKKHPDLWGLVNNAGVIPDHNIRDCSYSTLTSLFKINTFSAFVISSLFLDLTEKSSGGRIVNISSVAVNFGMGRNQGIQYAATKASLEALTTGLARIGAAKNILVNAIRPGCILTKIQESRPDLEQRQNLIPLKRMGLPSEVAGLVSYFLSEKASFTTGQIVSVSGGE